MSLFVLDTDTFPLFLRGHQGVCQRVEQSPAEQLAVTIITVEESLTRWYSQIRRARRDQEFVKAYESLQQTVHLVPDLQILPFEANAVRVFHRLRKSHRRVASNDLRIAAIVLNHSGVLITRNSSDFSGIRGLALEDWSQPGPPGPTTE